MITGIENKSENNEQEVTFVELLAKFKAICNCLIRKWFLLLFFALFGGILGFLYAKFTKAKYTATTTFVLEDDKSSSGLGSLAGLASIAGVDVGNGGGGIFQGDNILELYKSRLMIEKSLLTLDEGNPKRLLIDSYLDFNGWRDKWKDNPELSKLTFNNIISESKRVTFLRDSIIAKVVKDINKNYLSVVKPDKKISIIEVNVKAEDESFAKKFNDALVKNVNEFYVQAKTKKSLNNIRIIQHKTDSVRSVMNGAIYSAVMVADATPNLNPTRQIQRTAPVQRSQFSAETNKAVLSEMIKNLELAKMALLRETPLIQVIDSPIFPLDKESVGKVFATILGAFIAGGLAAISIIFKSINT